MKNEPTIFNLTQEEYEDLKKDLEEELHSDDTSLHRKIEIISLLYYINQIIKEFYKKNNGGKR